jgi:hypothetical protein
LGLFPYWVSGMADTEREILSGGAEEKLRLLFNYQKELMTHPSVPFGN